MPDLNAYDLESAMDIVEGTARNMGIAIKGINDAELREQAKEALEAEKEMAKLDAELETMEEEAKEMAEGNVNVEVESTEQNSNDEETEEK